MTESNITKEHEGKHGVLTLGGSHNGVTMVTVAVGYSIRVRIDGSESMNSFYLSDGWQFTPDPDPLPTEPGWYVCTSTTDDAYPLLYSLNGNGEWHWHHSSGSQFRNAERMVKLHERYPLVRVSFGVAS